MHDVEVFQWMGRQRGMLERINDDTDHHFMVDRSLPTKMLNVSPISITFLIFPHEVFFRDVLNGVAPSLILFHTIK